MEVTTGTSKQQDLREHLFWAQISAPVMELGQDLGIFPLKFWFPWDQNTAQSQDLSSHLHPSIVLKTNT